MLDNIRNRLQSDEATKVSKADGVNSVRVFDNLRRRATNVIPSFQISVASVRERAFGSTTRKEDDASGTTLEGNVSSMQRSGTANEDPLTLNRRRSTSTPPELPNQSLRRRAMFLKDSTLSEIWSRANAFDLSRLPSFHFALPFSDSNPLPQTRDDAIDNMNDIQRESDNLSITSLEFESLAINMKAENNRLRGLIDGLPRLGIPGIGAPEPAFAGLSELTKDLNIVILGGYRGSILRSTEDNRMLWIPVKVGLGIRKVNLELPLDPEAEREAAKTIYPDCMLSHIGPIDISRRLLKRLGDMEDKGFCKVHSYGFDWRLGGHFLSDQLIGFLAGLSGKTIVIAHSLGGLITLHALNRRPELFASVLLAGVPFGGCPNILGPFRYGDGVLLNKDILNARTNFSMRSSFLLLPTHKRCFVDIATGKELPVDFFDPDSWREYGLSPEVAKDHGAGDIGEAYEENGLLASGGIGGPSFGGSVGRDDDKARNTSLADRGTQSASQAREKVQMMEPERRQAAQDYLERTLKSTLLFKSELKGKSDFPYPSIALLRSASTPTVRGCNVLGEQGIRDGDYSKFIFSPGDGVVTYAASDIRTFENNGEQSAYSPFVVKDVENDRGHIGLLGDLAGVEECLSSLVALSLNPSQPPSSFSEQVAPVAHQSSVYQDHPLPLDETLNGDEAAREPIASIAASNIFKLNPVPTTNTK